MAGTDPLTGSRYPTSGDQPNVNQAIQNAVFDLADNTVPRFTTTTTRDSAYATWVSQGGVMQAGMVSATTGDKRFWRYDGSAWRYFGGAPAPIVLGTAAAGWSLATGRAAGAYMDGSGLVHLVGAVTPQTNYNPQDGGNHSAFNLPSGYWPATTVPVSINTGRSLLAATISTAGVLAINDGDSTLVTATTLHPLESVSFHPGYTGTAMS